MSDDVFKNGIDIKISVPNTEKNTNIHINGEVIQDMWAYHQTDIVSETLNLTWSELAKELNLFGE